MSIVPFNIVNQDGSINQPEYERCINFLNDYTSGLIKIYPEVSWANPLEVDMTRDESALEILSRYILYSSNKLINKQAFDEIKKLFKGILERYGSTIHSYGKYIEQSKYFTDGPGYKYDVFLPSEAKVKTHQLNTEIAIHYLDDENHTVLEYNDLEYCNTNPEATLPETNFPQNNIQNNSLTSNVSTYPNVYKGNLCGVYSDFQRLSGQYVGSSTLFYYSLCNDQLYTTGGTSYTDPRTKSIYNFNYKASVSNKSKPTRGVSLSTVKTAQSNISNESNANAFIEPSLLNTEVNYLTPTFFTAEKQEEWILPDETQKQPENNQN